MSTLGHQPVVLGGFFSAVEDEFLPGMALWTSDDVNNHKTVINHPKQTSQWSSHQTMEEKLKMFHIDVRGSLSVDLRSAKIKAKGSYEYLNEEEVVRKILFIRVNFSSISTGMGFCHCCSSSLFFSNPNRNSGSWH